MGAIFHRSTVLGKLGIATLLILAVGCGGPEQRKAKYRTKAQEYMQAGNFPKARVALRNVLKIDPKDSEAYFLYAQVEEKEKDWRHAFAHYLQVVELNPTHEQALVKLGKFYLQGRLDEKARETADQLLRLYPGHVSARAIHGALLAAEGKLTEAIAAGETLVKQFPTEPDAAILLGTLYSLQNAPHRVEAVLKKAVEAHPRDLDLLNSLAMAYMRVSNQAKAEAVFRNILAIEPQVFDHHLKLALFFDQQRQYEKAEATLREALRLEPESEQRHLALADYLAGRRNVAASEAALAEARRALPHAVNIQLALGRLYEMHQQPDKARTTYQELRDRNQSKPAGDTAKVKLATLDWVEGKQDVATEQLQEVLRNNPRASEALMLQGRIALQQGAGREAVQAFRTVLKDQPEKAEAYALLGQAHLMLEETNLARENLEKAVTLSPTLYQAHLALAILDASSGRTRDARLRLEELLKQAPTNLGTLGMLLNLQAADRDWDGSDQTLSRIRAAGANQFVSDLAEGNLYQARLQWDKAIAAFERAAAQNPDAPEPTFALVRIDTRQGKLAQAQNRLANLIAKNPRHQFAHGLLGEILILKGDPAGAEAEFRLATGLKPEWSTPWVNWVTLKLSQRKGEEANEILQHGLQVNPKNEELRLLYASHLGDRGQFDLAITEYETILSQNPRDLMAANNLAAILTDQKGDTKSLDRALALSRDFEQRAPNPFFLDTLGWVHLKMGHQDDALRVIQRAVAQAPQHPLLNYHLGMAHFKAGHRLEAQAHLKKALNSKQPFPGMDEAKAVLAEVTG